MFRRLGLYAIGVFVLTGAVGAQGTPAKELAAFQSRLDQYVAMHRRLEGPLPPMAVTSNMDDVHRLMDALRGRIRAERQGDVQGHLFSPGMITLLHQRIAGCMTPDDIRNAMEDIEEHTPPGMPALRINEPLPEDAPFGMVPPQALRELPPLPDELRYMVLSKALLVWDHHANLVVDIAPGLFDASTYAKRHHSRR
jgi:hypothetical protein